MKIIKTLIAISVISISSLLFPIFGQWYEQKTEMTPVLFYAFSFIGGCTGLILTLTAIWDDKFRNNL